MVDAYFENKLGRSATEEELDEWSTNFADSYSIAFAQARSKAQQLQDATSIMMTSDGPVTVINAPNNSINNSSGDTNYQEMNVDHDDKSGSWWSRVDLTPWN